MNTFELMLYRSAIGFAVAVAALAASPEASASCAPDEERFPEGHPIARVRASAGHPPAGPGTRRRAWH